MQLCNSMQYSTSAALAKIKNKYCLPYSYGIFVFVKKKFFLLEFSGSFCISSLCFKYVCTNVLTTGLRLTD